MTSKHTTLVIVPTRRLPGGGFSPDTRSWVARVRTELPVTGKGGVKFIYYFTCPVPEIVVKAADSLVILANTYNGFMEVKRCHGDSFKFIEGSIRQEQDKVSDQVLADLEASLGEGARVNRVERHIKMGTFVQLSMDGIARTYWVTRRKPDWQAAWQARPNNSRARRAQQAPFPDRRQEDQQPPRPPMLAPVARNVAGIHLRPPPPPRN